MAAHGDDSTCCGVEEDLLRIKAEMETWFGIKMGGIMGDGENDVTEIVILGRIVRWAKEGIEYEADPKHRRIILQYLGLEEGTRGFCQNRGKAEAKDQE